MNGRAKKFVFSPDEVIEKRPLQVNDFILELLVQWKQIDGAKTDYIKHYSGRCSVPKSSFLSTIEGNILELGDGFCVQNSLLDLPESWSLAPQSHPLKVPRARSYQIAVRLYYCPDGDIERRLMFPNKIRGVSEGPDPVTVNTFVGAHRKEEEDLVEGMLTVKGVLVASYSVSSATILFEGMSVPLATATERYHGRASTSGVHLGSDDCDEHRCFEVYIMPREGGDKVENGCSKEELIRKGAPLMYLEARRSDEGIDSLGSIATGKEPFTNYPIYYYLTNIRIVIPQKYVNAWRHTIEHERMNEDQRLVIDPNEVVRSFSGAERHAY